MHTKHSLLFVPKLCMKKLTLRGLKTRRNTSWSGCPRTEAFVAPSTPPSLSRWKTRWPHSRRPGRKLRSLELAIKLGVYFTGNSDICSSCLKGASVNKWKFLPWCIEQGALFLVTYSVFREVSVLFLPAFIRRYTFSLFSTYLCFSFIQTINGMQWEYQKLLIF